MDNPFQAKQHEVYGVSKGCPQAVMHLCEGLGEAVHETACYPQGRYAQVLGPTCPKALGAVIHSAYIPENACRFRHNHLIFNPYIATYMWISNGYAGTMAACFGLTGYQLRGCPCQWNFGSSA